MFNFFDKSDSDIKRDVLNELNWDPSINATHVKVVAKNGIVTLRGNVPHFIEKLAAEQAAQRVGGVNAVADELEVKGLFEKTDEEIAAAAIYALKWNYSVPNTVKISVEKGWITMSGEAEWNYQRNAAMDAIGYLVGVTGVTNNISISPQPLPSDIKSRISDALKRSAESEGREIGVSINGGTVTLSGKVHSFSESDDARAAAWNAPGVTRVNNDLVISQ